MKKYLFVILSFVILASCSKKEPVTPPVDPTAAVKAQIEGTWQMVKIDVACYDLANAFLRNDKYVYYTDGRDWTFSSNGNVKRELCGYDKYPDPGTFDNVAWNVTGASSVTVNGVPGTITVLDAKNFTFRTDKYERLVSCGGCGGAKSENHVATYIFTR